MHKSSNNVNLTITTPILSFLNYVLWKNKLFDIHYDLLISLWKSLSLFNISCTFINHFICLYDIKMQCPEKLKIGGWKLESIHFTMKSYFQIMEIHLHFFGRIVSLPKILSSQKIRDIIRRLNSILGRGCLCTVCALTVHCLCYHCAILAQ
jgi:hypothetical protein